MDKITATVKILGREYTITGPESTEHMRRVAELVDRKMREIQKDHFGMVPNLLALMTAINIADEYIKFKETARQAEASRELKRNGLHPTGERSSSPLPDFPAPGIQKLPRIGEEGEEPVQRRTNRYTLFPKQSDIGGESIAMAAGIARMAARAAEEAPLEDVAEEEESAVEAEQDAAEDALQDPEVFAQAEAEPVVEAPIPADEEEAIYEDERGGASEEDEPDEEPKKNEYLDQTIFDGF